MVSSINEKKQNVSLYLLLALAMLYVAFKLTCNPLFFRQTLFTIPFTHINIRIVSSAFMYPAIYVISDAIVALSNRTTAIVIIMFGVICDSLFSFATYFITSLHMPTIINNEQLINTNYINHLGPQIWKLFYHGLAAAIAAAIIEVILFNFIFKKSHNFFISTITSVIITLLAHNTITDYPMLRSDKEAWKVIFNGLAMNISLMIIYAIFISIILYSLKIYSNFNPTKREK